MAAPFTPDPANLRSGIDTVLDRDRAETDESLRRERLASDTALAFDLETHVGEAIEEHRSRIDDRVEEIRERRDDVLESASTTMPEVAETLEQAADALDDVAVSLAQTARGLKFTAGPDQPTQAALTVSEVAETLSEVAERVATERQVVDESIDEERALMDEVLDQERSLSDAAREFERSARRMLLEAERQRTDLHLAEERRDTDAAVKHALDLLIDEQASRVEAEQRTLTRDEFLAIVSHDLRMPLDAIAINATLLAENAPPGEDGEKQRKWARNIRRSVDVMSRLVSDLLDVARLDGGEFRIAREEGDVSTVVKEAVDTFAAPAAARQLTLDVNWPTAPVHAWFDHDRVLQVLLNLLRNAIHFTPAGGSISVSVKREEGGCRVAVRDTGIGIPESQQARIFDRFQQLRSADRKGLGLGLYISRRIIDAHGGRIWVESRPGQGSTFIFTLPGR